MNTEFQLLMNHPHSNEYMVAIKNIDLAEKKEIITQIKKNQTKLDIKDYQLTLHTKNKNYTFDLSSYQKLISRFQGLEIGIGLVFMDENNQIIRDFVQFFVIKA
jgi:hypothetical protein